MKTKIFILGMIACLLSACAAGNLPKLIASQRTNGSVIDFPLANSPPISVIFTATIDLEVKKVDKADRRVREITYQQGGYVSDSKTWHQDGEEHRMVKLVVAAYRFENVRSELLRLGALKNERLSGTQVEPGDYPTQDYTHIIVFLHPKSSTGILTHLPDWRPLRTLAQAWEVFLGISGFILDVAIWLAVVVGPFVLIAWGIRSLLRRWKHSQGNNPANQESDTQTEV